MKTRIARTARLAAVLAGLAVLPLTGCIGIYNNSNLFQLSPNEGLDEVELLKRYGAPDFSGYVENRQVYVYKVRNNRYIVLFGLYEGYDMVVTCENGVVRNVSRVERPQAFALLNPVPWAETK
jgi:hypothetical protein